MTKPAETPEALALRAATFAAFKTQPHDRAMCDCDDCVAVTESCDCGVCPTGVWVAYYGDESAMVPFASELDALRYAVENSASVTFLRFGESLRSALARQPRLGVSAGW